MMMNQSKKYLLFLLLLSLPLSLFASGDDTTTTTTVSDGDDTTTLLVAAAEGTHPSSSTTTRHIHNNSHRNLQVISDTCEETTDELVLKNLVAAELNKIDDYLNDANNIQCTQSDATGGTTRTTCILDFANAIHDLQDICDVYGAIYSESNYTYRCDQEETGDFLIYNEFVFPMCVDISCGQTGWKAYQQNGADAVKNWLQSDAYVGSTCKQLRLQPEVVDLPKEQPKNCQDATTQIMDDITIKTPGLTDHRNTKAIDCTNIGNGDFECSIDFSDYDHGLLELCNIEKGIYLEVDYTIICTGNSGTTLTLQGIHDPYCVGIAFCQPSDFVTLGQERPNSMIDILNDEGYNCQTSSIVTEDFEPSSKPTTSPAPTQTFSPSSTPTKSPAPTKTMEPSSTPTDLSCSGKTNEILGLPGISSSNSRIDAAMDQQSSTCTTADNGFQQECEYDYTGITHTLIDDCSSIDGLYIEHTMEVLCVQGSTKVETIHTYVDKPFCFASRCKGIEMDDYLYDYYRNQIPDADVICPSHSLLEVLVGGRVSVTGVDVGDGCQAETNVAISSIDILNAKGALKQDFIDLVTGEIRNICTSPSPGKLDCDFDFEELGFRNSIINACPQQNGQYVTSTFTVTCTDPDDGVEVSFTNSKVPSCVGQCCSPGESMTLLQDDLLWFTDYYENTDNWDCTEIEVKTISTLEYDPNAVCNTQAPGGSPTLPPNNNGANKPTDCSKVFGCYENLNTAMFGQLYKTLEPTPAPNNTDLDIEFNDGGINDSDDNGDGGLSGATAAGIAIGALLFVCCLCALLFLGYRQKRREREEEQYSEHPDDDYYSGDEEQYDMDPREGGFHDEGEQQQYYNDQDQTDARTWTTRDWEGDEETNYQSRGGGDGGDYDDDYEDGDGETYADSRYDSRAESAESWDDYESDEEDDSRRYS